MPEPTREQEAKLQYLTWIYDRITVYGSIGDDLLAFAERVDKRRQLCRG